MATQPDPQVCRGAPRVQGTRLTVYNVVPGAQEVTAEYGVDVGNDRH
jgi:uncharacterized protein (DUF433 family)